MNYIADLHIHSPYSRATSRESTLAGLCAWARVKGIQVVATGDFTHPGWYRSLKEELEPAEPGLFRLKNEDTVPAVLPGVAPSQGPVRFLLSAEISCIYKRHGTVRKVHNLLYVPDFASAERINAKLAAIGNIESDGRPILGLDSRDLLEIFLECAPEGFFVPAHIWTPWFSLFGSRSGFDSIDECFGDLTSHIFALETGLSSDPDMNRLISSLDRFSLISNSDCHSPSKLGREANLLATGFDFFSLREAIRGNRRDTFRGTVEFFPEEGKYHFDGHRACNVCLDPHETRRLGLLCPECGKPLTVGVHHRVMELADRELPVYQESAPRTFSLIPLPEVLGEILCVGPGSKEVAAQYARSIDRFGSEFGLLLDASVEDIRTESPLLGEAVERMREGRVIRQPGYDGEFGVIRVFDEGELDQLRGQAGLFGEPVSRRGRRKQAAPLSPLTGGATPKEEGSGSSAVNPEQEAAIAAAGRHILVSAGPGTGKTHVLISRLSALLASGADPGRVCAITFTTKAADEVRERLLKAVDQGGERVFVGTFHRFCLDRLRQEQPDLAVVGPESRERLVRRLFPEMKGAERAKLLEEIEDHFLAAMGENAGSEHVARYLRELARLNAVDLDAVIPLLVGRLSADPLFRRRICAEVSHLFIDEFQDLNESQYRFVEMLAEDANVFAIGDPDQAIYGFRGSDPSFFFRFAERPETKCLPLGRTYRCASPIVTAAGAVISRNRSRSGNMLTPHARHDGSIELYSAPTPEAEAEFIVRHIEEMMGGIENFSHNSGRGGDGRTGRGRSFGDFAVLFRLGRQADEIAEALERRGIPLQRVGSVPFYLKPDLRALYYFIQAAAGSRELAEWLLLLKELPGIGENTLLRLEEALPLVGDFFQEVAAVSLPPAVLSVIAGLRDALQRFSQECYAGLDSAVETALRYHRIPPDNLSAKRFIAFATSFGTALAPFADHLRRHAAATVYDERAEAVSLMTLHAAKGLEFPVIFLAGAEEGLLPCTLMGKADVEEERRLFYVGLTRAKEKVVITAAATRPWAGNGVRFLSRFAGEIPAELLMRADNTNLKSRTKSEKGTQLELF